MQKAIPRPTRKFAGDYGGPGTIVAEFEYEGRRRFVVAFKIEGGHGEFFHILSPNQLEEIKPQEPKRSASEIVQEMRRQHETLQRPE